MRKLIVGIVLAIVTLGASPALARGPLPNPCTIYPIGACQPKPTPCEAFQAGRPVYDHLRYWANLGWKPYGSVLFLGPQGQVCYVDPISQRR